MKEKTKITRIEINKGYCKGCGICITLCPNSVFESNLGRPVVKDLAKCTGCRNCELWCPDFAIDIEEG